MNLTGQSLGDFQLQNVVSHGPRATVYRARQLPVDRVVAVKVYDESIDPDVVQRAVEAGEPLTQANVLPVYGFGVHHGLAYVAMRHMPVGSAKARWRGAAPLNDVARIVPQVAAALDHAHAHSLLHLNLKPTNVLLDHPGNAFVADYGVPPQAGSPYAAPETGRNGPVNARADVYGFGAVLYELLCGRPPVARRPRGDEAHNLRPIDLPSPRSVRGSLPQAIDDVVMQAMAIDPEARYATPGALAEAFAEAMKSAPHDAARAARPAPWRWIAVGLIAMLVVVAAALAANLGDVPVVATATPSPTSIVAEPPTPTEAHTLTLTRTATRAATRAPTRTPAATAATTRTLVATTRVFTATVLPNATPTLPFTVASLGLKEPPTRADAPDRLDLFFDAVVQPSTGGPFGQLFAYLPDIDSLVANRIGAQVSSGTQLLHVTLIVDCGRLGRPFTTDRVLLEIRPTDRGPTLYATTIEYVKTWCR